MAIGLGALSSMECRECNKNCRHMHGLLSHLQATGHDGGASLCAECGRVSVTSTTVTQKKKISH